ncbi:hypothetical protein ACFSRY_17395 [Pontibacter locisalis]|uniref:Glycosyl transferase family 2 n=1 Tax=Pontibacter locisalis TaxID=1719035 RepID=A0ABW5IQD9_9BACT
MLAFVVPIKPKINSNDWEKDNQLLSRTLKSICNQTDNNFIAYVIYHEKPVVEFEHPNIRYIFFPFEYTLSEDIEDLEDYALKYYGRQYAEYMFDKSKKITYGCKNAIDDGCKYIMAIDSDDLISNKIAEFINSSDTKCPGWVVERGYIYLEGSNFLIKSNNLHGINGSTHIIKSDLVPVPDLQVNKLKHFNFFEAHGYLRQRIIDLYNLHLQVLPFYGTVYTIHKNNTSAISDIINRFQLKTYLKYILKGKLVDKAVREQFNLYKL